MRDYNTNDLPHGTPVMCRAPHGSTWAFQFYRRAGVTTDDLTKSESRTGWSAICTLDKFTPDARDWQPQVDDDYARHEG